MERNLDAGSINHFFTQKHQVSDLCFEDMIIDAFAVSQQLSRHDGAGMIASDCRNEAYYAGQVGPETIHILCPLAYCRICDEWQPVTAKVGIVVRRAVRLQVTALHQAQLTHWIMHGDAKSA